MLSFLKNWFWAPPRQQAEISGPLPEGNRKRRPSATERPLDIKRSRGFEGPTRASWNLDLEQADYRFSRETISIFKGGGATVLVSRRGNQDHCPPASLSRHQSLFSPPQQQPQPQQRRSGLFDHLLGASRQQIRQESSASLSQQSAAGALSALRRVENLPAFCQAMTAPTPFKLPPPQPLLPTAAAAAISKSAACVHSTPLPAMAGSAGGVGRAAASTAPKPADQQRQQQQQRPTASGAVTNDDDDCVITSVEGPKSVAEMFSPCKYMSSDWLADVKTSSQSLKSYMHKNVTEETLKMQYWAKLREAEERDLVARVTRNLKLAERELPVLPYKYEEPPPTPPPSPPEPEPVPEEPEFPDLTEDQLRSVERAWSRQLSGSEVLAEGFSLRVTREELRSLCGLNWLNDNIVNFYMQLLAAREGPGLPRVHAFSTFFYTKLSSGGYASVRRWTRKVDIFDREVLLCPVHLHNNHWTLCIVDLRSRYIIHLDSLASHGGGGSDPTCLPLIRQYLVEEHRDKKGSELDASEFQLVREVGAPRQENGSDCGVFCCKFADYYCKGREFTFRQANMPYFRKRTTLEILEKRLLW